MKRHLSRELIFLFLLSLTLFMTGCTDMYDQPSFKPQEGPRLTAPEGAVPLRGIENFGSDDKIENTGSKNPETIESGRKLFLINCALCHGYEGRGDGSVGKKLEPPPPNLRNRSVQGLDDADIFRAITNGYGRMPAFGKRIPTQDRWNLVIFVRELSEN